MPESPTINATVAPQPMPMPWVQKAQEREDEEIRKRYPKFHQERERRKSNEGA